MGSKVSHRYHVGTHGCGRGRFGRVGLVFLVVHLDIKIVAGDHDDAARGAIGKGATTNF